jgi:hypothetical protein
MGGIAFDGTGTAAGSPTNRLRFFEFEHGNRPDGFEGVIGVNETKLVLEDCTVRDMPTDGVNGVNSRVEIHRSLFDRVWESVHVHGSATVVILDSTFSNTIGDSDVLSLKSGGLNGERGRVERCLLEYGFEDGIDTGTYTVDIRDNVFRFLDKAISLEVNGPEGFVTVTGNVIHDCGMGIAVKNGIRIDEGSHNTIVGCQEGISLYQKAGGSDGGHAVFDSMILWDNIRDVTVDAYSSVSFTYCDIGDGLWPGVGNISLDPKFTDLDRDDFSLTPGSPAVGTGRAGTDMGAIPYAGTVASFIRGDADANRLIELTDAIICLDYLFRSGSAPTCLDRLDSNDDGAVDITDPVFLLLYLFGGGGAPPPPFPSEGTDPTGDAVVCR